MAIDVSNRPLGEKFTMLELMQLCVEKGASDIHISVGRPPTLRLDSRLEKVGVQVIGPKDSERLMEEITPTRHQQAIMESGCADFGYSYLDIARFRVSAFRARGEIGIVLRLIPYKILTFEQLGLPPAFIKELLCRPRGLVLVTGPTGSGKTTTLATMIDWINENRDAHVITVEDPIEYYHPHKKGIMTHRELGVDTPSFAAALKHALRQDPDVILVGEMRDLETMEAAITAAETGHLVFATLHTNSASQTVERIIDAFPVNQQEQIRMQLSISIIAVLCQALCPRSTGRGRVAAYEILINTPAIANLIRERKTNRILSSIQTGQKLGMITMDQFLLNLYQRGDITAEMALERSQDGEDMRAKIMGVKRT
jgi:twitching motility protein PilT